MGLTVLTKKELEKRLASLATHIFREGVTWSKVASFYNLVSAAAKECVHKVGEREATPEYCFRATPSTCPGWWRWWAWWWRGRWLSG